MKSSKVVVYILCLVYSTASIATTSVSETGNGTTAAPTNPSKINTTGGTVAAPQYVPPAPTQNTINQGANTGQNAENGGSGANNAAGAALIAAGTPLLSNPQTMPMGMALIAMGILALMQGGSDSGDAGQSGNTAATSAFNNTGGTTTGAGGTAPSPSTDGGLNAAFATKAGQDAQAALASVGASISANGLTTADGTTTPLSSFSSPSAMSAAGFDGKQAQAILAGIEKKLGIDRSGKVSGMALAEGSGGGGAANEFGKELEPFKMPKFGSPFDLSAADKAKMLAGKTVTLGGDPVGVAGDDLFAMIHRAYVRKTTTDEFINGNGVGEAPSVSVRAPASVIRKRK